MGQPTERPQEFTLNQQSQLAQGLVFAGLGRFPQSTRYHDSSLYRNSGTLTGMSVPATATSGWVWDNTLRRRAMRFDGSDDYIPLQLNIELKGHYTISAFHTPNSNYTTEQVIIANFTAEGSASDFVLSFGFADNKYNLWVNSDGRFSESTTAINTNARNHIAATKIGSTGAWQAAYYLNGIPDGTATTVLNPNGAGTVGVAIGRAGLYPTGFMMNGTLADVCLWKRALSPSEIRQLADPSNVMLSGLILPPRRRIFAAGVAAPATNRRRRLLITGAYR